jgi:hypothetical protein
MANKKLLNTQPAKLQKKPGQNKTNNNSYTTQIMGKPSKITQNIKQLKNIVHT